MKFITWDTAILAVTGILLAYSLLIRRHKALATLVSLYIAYVMTSLWGQRVTEFLSGDRVFLNQVWIKSNASPFNVQLTLFVSLTVLISFFIKLGGKRSRYSVIEVIVYTITTMALAVILINALMPPEMRELVSLQSKIFPVLYDWREWILAVPVFEIIFFGILSDDE